MSQSVMVRISVRLLWKKEEKVYELNRTNGPYPYIRVRLQYINQLLFRVLTLLSMTIYIKWCSSACAAQPDHIVIDITNVSWVYQSNA